MKRSISLILALMMLFGMIPMTTMATEEETSKSISMQYDDHYDITDKNVEIIDTEDNSIMKLEGNYLVATGIGTTQVKIDGQLYDVTVEKAKINLIVIMGQSNAGNHFENATSDVTCPIGTAYWWGNGKGTAATEPVPYTQPSMGFHTPLLAELYAQSVAAGDPVKNVLIWEEGITSKNGQSIVKWAASATNTSGTDATVTMIQNCRNYYEKHSDKYEIVNSGVYWLQGESDIEKDSVWYTDRFMAMWQRLKNAGMEYVAFLRVRRASSVNTATRDDLYYSGSLSAQIKMINENPEFYMATTVTENWIGTVETSHDVDISRYITMMETYGQKNSYSDSHGNRATYANGILTTTMKELYGSNNTCHYGKFGYGIIGADAAYNMYKAMHTPNTAIEVTVTSGHADKQYVLTNGQEVTLDASAMTDNLSFRAAAGSAAGTLKFTIKSGANDITAKNGLVITSGEQYGAVNVQKLRDFEDVSIEITYTTAKGNTHTVVCTILTPAKEPKKDYIWDFDEDLYARSADGEIQNSLQSQALKGSYTLENGYLTGKDLQMALENVIELEADKNWSVEWKYGSLNGGLAGFLLCEKPGNTLGNKAIWHMNNGQLAIADYLDSKGYRNYTSSAVAIKDYDCLRMTNQYDSETGKSIISLWVNDELVISNFQLKGCMNGYNDKEDMSVHPLVANFSFAYLGSTGMADWDISCQLDYLKISFGEIVHKHEYTSTVTAPTCTEQGYTTYTCACGDSYVADYVNAKDHTYENGICTGCGVADWDTDGDGVLEILAIGNSFSIDALEYTYQIAQDLGIDEIVIGNFYISGCTLATHANNAAGDLGKYRYYYNDSGTWTTTDNYKISTALESRSWDYISLQQASGSSGVESTYNEDLTDLIAYVKARSDAKLVWHMTWAYQQDSTNTAFAKYGKDQMTMYNAILSAVQNKIVNNGSFDFIVPNGTAVQNSRTSLLGDTTTRDGYHMSRDYGQYLTGLMFIRTVTGLSVDHTTYAPSGVSALEKAIAIESVNNAIAKPFEITKSEYDEEGYILLQQELYKGAFWDSTSAKGYNVLYFDQSISHKYFATPRFTKEELPVGSIIILKEGWQYRPEGWVTDAAQSSRESMTTASCIVVTEEWWGDYTLRSFNLAKVGLPTLAEVTEDEVRLAFRIYVPEASHSHAFENGVCSGCGAVLGDLNCDGLVNSDDLTLLARHVARIESVTGTALANADVNGDGVVTSDDLTKLARYVARIITDWDQA